jgi:hypothetical protein
VFYTLIVAVCVHPRFLEVFVLPCILLCVLYINSCCLCPPSVFSGVRVALKNT